MYLKIIALGPVKKKIKFLVSAIGVGIAAGGIYAASRKLVNSNYIPCCPIHSNAIQELSDASWQNHSDIPVCPIHNNTIQERLGISW
ncbi:hypothetical protein NO1_0523 [Candidatus Termititenax aidoneus]|uniref:Uncharacterized protein n=1 Tax=Termititenax aidoneus TaxID=2218524 RepID=A0A388T8Y6_TERA1|nr:hypothetical protein NO1_0523 [Candidatus Termititenax aidoneus]